MYPSILSSFGLIGIEEKFFTLLLTHGPFEKRLYHPCVEAKMRLMGREDFDFSGELKAIQEYVNGNNFWVEKISNPGPLCISWKDEMIEVSVLLPLMIGDNEWPGPINRSIRLNKCESRQFCNLRFKGDISLDVILEKKDQLDKWAIYKGLKTTGNFRLLINSPDSYLDFFKTYDIQMEVK